MNFQDALTALQAGKKVRRTSWERPDTYIKIEDVRDVPPVHYQKYIATYFTQTGTLMPWQTRVYIPEAGDLIAAADWVVVA